MARARSTTNQPLLLTCQTGSEHRQKQVVQFVFREGRQLSDAQSVGLIVRHWIFPFVHGGIFDAAKQMNVSDRQERLGVQTKLVFGLFWGNEKRKWWGGGVDKCE